MANVSLLAIDGTLVPQVVAYLDADTLAKAFMPACRLCFSLTCCQPQSYRTPTADWRVFTLGVLFEHDKRLNRAVALAECIVAAQQDDDPHEDDQQDRLEDIALRTQMVSSLESAVSAAARHADECVQVTTILLRHTAKLSSLLRWLKFQKASLIADLDHTTDSVVARCRCIALESEEFGRRLALLARTAQTFASLMGGGSGGAMGRHQRLSKVLRMARVARPGGLGSEMEEQCERIHEVWRLAVRKVDAIVCSVQMRGCAFLEVATGGPLAMRAVVAIAAGCIAVMPGGKSAKFNVLTAIAASTGSSSLQHVSGTCELEEALASRLGAKKVDNYVDEL